VTVQSRKLCQLPTLMQHAENQSIASPLPLFIYLQFKNTHLDPHTFWKRKWLQIFVFFNEVLYNPLKLLPLAITIVCSYVVGLNGFMKNICYATDKTQRRERNNLDVYPQDEPSPVVVFIHGGAWGFNSKFDHHLVARKLQSIGFVVIIPDYSKYPYGNVEDMVDDVNQALEWTVTNVHSFGGNRGKMMLFGHSAGAHLIALTLIENALQRIGKTILLEKPSRKSTWSGRDFHLALLCSGVYDIASHYNFEAKRAVEHLSPMKPAMRGITYFPQYSPTTILRHLQAHDKETLLSVQNQLPEIHLIHAEPDATVPSTSSIEFYDILSTNTHLRACGVSLNLNPKLGHADFALGLMGGKGKEIMVPMLRDYFKRMDSSAPDPRRYL